ncbi:MULTISPECIES: AraC family transcriptional regulator [Gracilibacillus]|uniref:AraC family transcriptional regulator n=1 Tax=Gracilibacillus TaxID=74385 RepID=UPI0008254A80|nr:MULTISPECIES: AraC family transcriptional regulator [Gracilibacillus]
MKELFSVEYRTSSKPDQQHMHSHDAFEIYMFHHGKCRYAIHYECYELAPGDILLMNGLTLHKANVPSGCEYVRSHLHFSPELVKDMLDTIQAKEVLEAFGSRSHYLIRTGDDIGLHRVEEILKKIHELNRSEEPDAKNRIWEMKLLIGQLLVNVNGLMEKISPPLKSRGKTNHVERIINYVQTHFHEPITIGLLANKLSLNKSYVSHVFKEITGFTVMEYVMICRLKHAKYLLENDGDKTIKQIAYESGFENPAHFSRYFKLKESLSPKEYRKQQLSFYQ